MYPARRTRLEAVEISDLDADPLQQIGRWLEAARRGGQPMPEAMSLATATPEGRPSARMVVLRQLDSGLVFFTDDESDKAADLRANPRAAAVLHWLRPVHRQIRVAGSVQRVSVEEADRYWASRPPGARWAALASHQSRVVASRAVLEGRAASWAAHVPDETRLRRPPRWDGFRIAPETIEFWEECTDRLHDRLRFTLSAPVWTVDRLSP
jgi:pyridoxamine 5'-phosphate oxidase